MKLGKRTQKLVREAMVLGYVEGAYSAAGRSMRDVEATYPADTDIVVRVLRAARANGDLYPTLSKVEADLPDTEVMAWLKQQFAPVVSPGEQPEPTEGKTT